MALPPSGLAEAVRAWQKVNSERTSFSKADAACAGAPTGDLAASILGANGILAANVKTYVGRTYEHDVTNDVSQSAAVRSRGAAAEIDWSPASVVASLAGGGESTPARIRAFAARRSFAARAAPAPLWTNPDAASQPAPAWTPAVVKRTSGPRGSSSLWPAGAPASPLPRPAGDADADEGLGMATLLRRLEGAGVEVTGAARALARSSLSDSGGHVGRALNQALRKLLAPSGAGGGSGGGGGGGGDRDAVLLIDPKRSPAEGTPMQVNVGSHGQRHVKFH